VDVENPFALMSIFSRSLAPARIPRAPKGTTRAYLVPARGDHGTVGGGPVGTGGFTKNSGISVAYLKVKEASCN
jgi:hypothetical protein